MEVGPWTSQKCAREIYSNGGPVRERDSKEQVLAHSGCPSAQTRLARSTETRSRDAILLSRHPLLVAAHPERQLLETRSPSEQAWWSVRGGGSKKEEEEKNARLTMKSMAGSPRCIWLGRLWQPRIASTMRPGERLIQDAVMRGIAAHTTATRHAARGFSGGARGGVN